MAKVFGNKNLPEMRHDKKQGCCDDDDRLLKSESQPDVLLSQASFPQPEYIVVNNCYSIFDVSIAGNFFKAEHHNNSPPGLSAVPMYITNCAYLI